MSAALAAPPTKEMNNVRVRLSLALQMVRKTPSSMMIRGKGHMRRKTDAETPGRPSTSDEQKTSTEDHIPFEEGYAKKEIVPTAHAC